VPPLRVCNAPQHYIAARALGAPGQSARYSHPSSHNRVADALERHRRGANLSSCQIKGTCNMLGTACLFALGKFSNLKIPSNPVTKMHLGGERPSLIFLLPWNCASDIVGSLTPSNEIRVACGLFVGNLNS
jgi:hypothetical protein